jgi:hypothetical protein
MLQFTIDAPGVITTNEDGLSYELYGLAALGPRHILNTIRFWERRSDLGELSDSPDFVAWDVDVPQGAQLVGVTSAVSTELAHQYWVGWLLGRSLHMQALKQEAPFTTQLLPGEAPIFPAIMDKAGRSAVYSWRPSDDGRALWRRTFAGDIHQPVTMVERELARIPGRPLAARIAPISNLQTSHALLGWVEESPAGTVLGVALIDSDQVRLFRSDPMVDVSPLARQRLGLWAESYDSVELDVVVRSKEEPFSYSLARFSIGQNNPMKDGWWHAGPEMPPAPFLVSPDAQKQSLVLTRLNLPAGTLHAAALEHFKQRCELSLHQTYLTTDGRVLVASQIGGELREVLRNIPLDDPLAVVTGAQAAYWGTRRLDGSITLNSF